MMTPREGIARAIKHFGNETRLAEAIGFTAPAVRRARQLGRPTPEMCVNIEAATCGKIKRIWLRPDVFAAKAELIRNSWTRKRSTLS